MKRKKEITTCFLNLVLVIAIQLVVYTYFLQSKITSWGATEQEVKSSLVGDELAPYISATRAIAIKAPMSKVWNVLTQLGADRGGFFSYEFLEKALGYTFRDPGKVGEEKYELKVGRIIPGSLVESESFIKYNFPVVSVDEGKSFVLKGWGAFVLKEVAPGETRLIVRTHGRDTPDLKSRFLEFIGVAGHFLMERRMLMGIKARAESGSEDDLMYCSDLFWFIGLVLSGIGYVVTLFVFPEKRALFLSIVFSLIWLGCLFVFDPVPIHVTFLLLLEIMMMVRAVREKSLDPG